MMDACAEDEAASDNADNRSPMSVLYARYCILGVSDWIGGDEGEKAESEMEGFF